MKARSSTTGLLHPLSWYITEYGLPEQTVVNAYKRGWPLDDPHKLLEKLIRAPGPKSKGLQALMNYVNGQRGPSAGSRGSSESSRNPKAESSVKEVAGQQSDDPPKFVRLELAFGSITMSRMITPAEADKVIQLSTESWLTNVAE
jgi:hypothetical protein